jgi:hypothetical protein
MAQTRFRAENMKDEFYSDYLRDTRRIEVVTTIWP